MPDKPEDATDGDLQWEWVEGCAMRRYEGDTPITCGFLARAETEEEVAKVARAHREKYHPPSEGWTSPPKGGWRRYDQSLSLYDDLE